MSTYEDIFGKRVKFFDEDPTLDSSYEGQVWYNSATGTLKSVVSFASWTAAPDMSQARRSAGGFGIQTAAVIVGGDNGAGTFFYRNVEEYNGTGFSTGTNIPEMGAPNPGNYLGITDMGQAGTETAGLIFGGESYSRPGNMTAEYDGSSWTITGNMNNLRRGTGCGGTQTAAFACGGYDGSNRAYTEHYNGSSWTNSNAMNTARMCAMERANLAPQTAGLVFGGSVVPGSTTRTNTEEYDGTNWTTGGALNNATLNAAGGGTQTAGLKFGGGPPETTTISSTENYDGSSWTTGTNMGTLRRQTAGLGSQTAAITAGGRTTTNLATTEEYNVSINTFTAAAWAAGGNVNTARNYLAGMGTQTAGLVAGGYNGSDVNNSEEYNGTSWTEGNNITTTRSNWSGAGTQTAGWGCGGYITPGVTANTELYDGTSWSETGNLNTAIYNGATFGVQTAGVVAGGGKATPSLGTRTDRTEHFNGSAWTAVPGTLSAATRLNIGFGTQTAGVSVGGTTSTGSVTTVNEYNGSAWTNVTGIPAATFQGGAAGTQTDGLYFGGRIAGPAATGVTLGYDGTSWSTRPSMGTARAYGGPANAGSSTSTFLAAGSAPVSAATEEFTGQTETATAKTLTTS